MGVVQSVRVTPVLKMGLGRRMKHVVRKVLKMSVMVLF